MAMWVCPACSGENPEGMRFCGHCGAPAAGLQAGFGTRDRPEAEITEALRSFVSKQVADRLVEAGGRITEERRLVTCLFADLSGFTPLADRLDPEQLLEVIDPLIQALANIVGKYEGYVDKYAGDALLAFFGAPISHEDDAERALRVALDMHRELEELRPSLPVDAGELTLHVGVNSGHVIARILGTEARLDYSVLGDAVILAQRLESAAPAGQTYVGETTHRLTRSRFDFEPIGQLTLKGKREPVSTWRLVGQRADSRAAIGEGHRRPGLVGREREVEAATSAIDALFSGRGGLLLLSGEPGVGKTRLTEEAWLHAREKRVRWFESRCVSYGRGLPYWPIGQLIRRANGIRSDAGRDESVEVLHKAMERLGVPEAMPYFARLLGLPLGSDGEEVARLDPEVFRRGLHDAFFSVVRAAAARSPLVIALEDAHWADPSTLQLVTQVLEVTRDHPILLYITTRPEGRASLAQLAAMVPDEDCIMLQLGPLDEQGVTSLIGGLLGGPAPGGLPSTVYERTAGNPFFAEEMVRSLQDVGELITTVDGWTMREGWSAQSLPPTIEGVISARIDLLSRLAALLLGEASAIGRRIREPLMRALAGERPDIGASLEELVRAGFLDPAEEAGEPLLMFHHALVQEVAYGRLLRRHRRDLHLRVAEAAEALYGSGDDVIDLLARHLYLGEAGTKAVECLVRAGDRARRLYANDEAVLHLQHALELVRREPDAATRAPDILLALAELEELLGEYEAALGHYDEVRQATNDIRAWRGVAATLRRRGEHRAAIARLEEAFANPAIQHLDQRPLWLERGYDLSMEGRLEEAVGALETGLTAGGDDQRDGLRAQLLLELARIETDMGGWDSALEHGLQAQRIFEESGDLRGMATVHRVVGGVHEAAGRLAQAAESLRQGLALAERVGSVEEIGGCLINLGLVELERKELEDAIACDRRAIELFERIGHGSGRAIAYANLAEKLMHTDQDPEALGLAQRAIDLARSIGDQLIEADATQTLAGLRLRQGNYEAAATLAEQAADVFMRAGAAPQAAAALTVAARAFEDLGDAERARSVSLRARSIDASLDR